MPGFQVYIPAAGSRRGSPAVAGPFLGAPWAVMGLEMLVASGARRVWVLSWCGSILPEVRIGDFIVPISAIAEEGTSAHYPLGGRRAGADPLIVRALTSRLETLGLVHHQGTVWTTDALYRETPAKVRLYQEQGVAAVEMELSALMTVAAFRGVALGALLVVSDELFEFKWRPGFRSTPFKESSRRAGAVLLDCIAQRRA